MPRVMLGADATKGMEEGISECGKETREAHWGLRPDSPSLLAPGNRMRQPVGLPALLSWFRVVCDFLGRTACPINYLRLPESLTCVCVVNGYLMSGKHSKAYKLPSSTGDRVCWGVCVSAVVCIRCPCQGCKSHILEERVGYFRVYGVS